MDNYLEFHKLKKEIATKLLTIQDGDRLDGTPDDMMATGTNYDAFNECFVMMQQAKLLIDDLARIEELE